MAEIETFHLGRRVTYSDNRDVWLCDELDMEAKTLSAMKAKIADHEKLSRRVDVRLMHFSTYYGRTAISTQAVLLEDDKHVWCNTIESKTDRFGHGRKDVKRREKVKFAELVEDTPEVRALLTAYIAQDKKADEERDRARKMHAAIPRVTLARLKEMGLKKDGA